MITDEEVNFIWAGDAGRPSVRHVAAVVASAANIDLDLILGHSRRREVARARQLAMWKARKMGHTYAAIGRALNRDHTTVVHGVRETERRLKGGA